MSHSQSTVSLQRLSRTPYPRASPSPSQIPSRRLSEYRQSDQRASELLRQRQLHTALDSQIAQQRKTLESLRDLELQLDTSAISLCKAQEKHFRVQQTQKRLERIAIRQKLEREHRFSVQRQSFEVAKQQENDRKCLFDQFRLHNAQLQQAKAAKLKVKSLLQSVIRANSQAISEKRQAKWREVEQDRQFARDLQGKLEEEELGRGTKGAVAGIRGSLERKRLVLQRRQQTEYREKLDKQVAEKRRRGWQEWREAQVTHSTLF